MKWWLEFKGRLISLKDSLKRIKKTHPNQLFIASTFAFLILIQLGVALKSAHSDHVDRKKIQSMEQISLHELSDLANNGNIKTIISHEVKMGSWMYPEPRSFLEIIDNNNNSFVWEKTENSLMEEEIGKMIFHSSIKNPIEFKTGSVIVRNSLSSALVVFIFLFGFILMLTISRTMATGTVGGHSFRPQKPDLSVNLDDVIGYDEVKRELREIKDQLLNPELYELKGVQPPRGILLTGEPGVGKTLMARAFANELKADFFTSAGADFAEMYVGVGPKRVRSLFKMARMSHLAVIFIDEFDALGSRSTMGNDTERLSTLTALLSEMDGVHGNGRLVVIAATNLPHKLDPALKRPGRFDQSVYIPLPDIKTREGILKHYLKNTPISEDVDLGSLALRTKGYSGAQLKNMIMESKRLAVREHGINNNWVINQQLLHEAQEATLVGVSENKSEGADLLRVAIHELGHGLAGYLFCPEVYVEKVTVKGRGVALGYAFAHSVDDKKLSTKKEMENQLVYMLAGRAAEEIILGDISGGAADDIRKANSLAQQMVIDYSMGEVTGFAHPNINSDGLLEINADIKTDIQNILSKAYEKAKETVSIHQDWIKSSSAKLMELGVLYHDQLFKDLPKPMEELSENQKWFNEVVKKIN